MLIAKKIQNDSFSANETGDDRPLSVNKSYKLYDDFSVSVTFSLARPSVADAGEMFVTLAFVGALYIETLLWTFVAPCDALVNV